MQRSRGAWPRNWAASIPAASPAGGTSCCWPFCSSRPAAIDCRKRQGEVSMTMAAAGDVTYELRDGVAWLGLDRPHKRNAIRAALLAAFQASVRRAHDEAHAPVTCGQLPCFSAG